VRRPPQVHPCGDRRVNIIGAEGQGGTPYCSLDLPSVARRSFTLSSTHVSNDTPEGGTEPLPQTPTQRPTGARVS
jgi:hypothetical protein